MGTQTDKSKIQSKLEVRQSPDESGANRSIEEQTESKSKKTGSNGQKPDSNNA